ncbi:MAG: head GIN domain-containing protein [Anaerolineaceae bacterium]|nr:head GIN domain-containing protein [Anaerolineaceae bacterium]
MKTKRIAVIFTLIASVFILSACGMPVTRGSGIMATETRQVSGYDAIEVEGFGKLIITQGDNESLEIEAEDNILPHITTKVRSGTLRIGYDEKGWRSTILPTSPVTFYIEVKDLNRIDLSGAADIQMDELQTTRLDLDVSGAGNVEIDNLQAQHLNVIYSGAGECKLGGEVQEQEVQVSGLGNYQAAALKSQTASVSLSGAGNMKVWAEDSLNIEVSGAGSVEYWGNPHVSQGISGIGNIQSRGRK